MRWDELFDDLESQLERGLEAEQTDLRAQEERLRIARLGLRDRLVALRGAAEPVRLELVDGRLLPLRIVAIGKDWVSGDVRDGSTAGRQAIVPLSAVAAVLLDGDRLRASLAARRGEEPLAARLGLAFVLRDLARRRAGLDVVQRGGDLVSHGTIDRVGCDHLDLALHEAAAPRRESAVTGYRTVPLERVLLVLL
ncbi:MAG: hypothetical protein QM635_02370 [Microbacteriaceae bacterium]